MTKCHIEFRNNNNLEIVHHLIYDTDCGPSFWADGLVFLDSLQLDPPTFRQSLITKINHRLEHNILATFISTIEAAVEAYKPVQNHKHFLESKVDPYPVILLLLFERLILFPILKEDDNNPTHSNPLKTTKCNPLQSIRPFMIEFADSNKAELGNYTLNLTLSSARHQNS